jgi:ribose/xylose/arabinose/galactoside ABC-type transport system permease subunit
MWNGEWFWNYRTPHATSIYNDFRYSLYISEVQVILISGGVPISGFTEEVRLLGNGRIDLTWLGLEKSQYLPVSVILIAVVFFLMWVFLNHTRTGKWIYAIGGNPNAARAAGINVNKNSSNCIFFVWIISWLWSFNFSRKN